MRKMIATAVAALWFGSAFAESTPLNDGWILEVSDEDVFDGTVTKSVTKEHSGGDESVLSINCETFIVATSDYFSAGLAQVSAETRVNDETAIGWSWMSYKNAITPNMYSRKRMWEEIAASQKLAVRVYDYETTIYVFDLTGIQDAVAALEC